MTTNADIKSDIQKLLPGQLVTLYELDTAPIGGAEVYYFTNESDGTGAITFNSVNYLPIPCQVEGFEASSDGALPTPTITVSNVLLSFAGASELFNDLVGAKFTRRRTFAKYLDGQPGANPNAQFPTDVYFVNRKTAHNKNVIAFELKCILAQGRKSAPPRQVMHICTHRYRVWNGSSFDYTNATCPYSGTSYFTETGTVTTAANDKCGKKLADCKLRYSSTTTLPFHGFPGCSRYGHPFR